jgi:hypothetical protein
MNFSPRTTLYRGSLIVFLALLLAYGAFEAYDLIAGPSLTILSPASDTIITDSLVSVEGETKNVTWLSLLGRPITINEHGVFKEKLLLPPGYSILTLEAKDRLGRRISKEIAVVRAGTELTAQSTASTTEPMGTPATTTSAISLTETP